MNGTDVSISGPDAVLDALAAGIEGLTPELRKAAAYVLENPNDVGVSSIRELSAAAKVKPNTFVRMAREVGFEGFEDFRAPFREEIRRGVVSFPDRARWLQSIEAQGRLGGLYADMVAATLRNIEESFAGIPTEALKAAADAIWRSRQVFVLGVGANASVAQNFAYLAGTGMDEFHAIPRTGSTAADDLARADGRDVLIALTCKPYRSEVVEAVGIAREQGVCVIGISDSPASPIILGSAHGFVVSVDTPQFFPSSVPALALLETLLSFVIAGSSPDIVQRVERFHARRHELGIYVEEGR
ncbi:MAG: MurR/RpiR family transcriptional regulator [Rhodobacter sp.]|nr:MurR/RpiR family transcriptional regulator [Rhodobacter sp.]